MLKDIVDNNSDRVEDEHFRNLTKDLMLTIEKRKQLDEQ